MIAHEPYENDPTPSREIVEAYRSTIEDDEDEEYTLSVVHYRGTREEYEFGVEYASSADPLDRVTGANILSQLGDRGYDDDPTFVKESVAVLIPMLKDADEGVLVATAMALGRRHDSSAVPHLIALENHKDPEVRWAVVYALGLARDEGGVAVEAIIRMSTDPDAEVRDWAIFSLGSQIEMDTPAIREALFGGLSDPHAEARGEALVGLAKRSDPRVNDAIETELRNGGLIRFTIEAIGITGDARWLPWLEEIQKDLAEAITLCRKED